MRIMQAFKGIAGGRKRDLSRLAHNFIMMRARQYNPKQGAFYYKQFYNRRFGYGDDPVARYLNQVIGRRCHDMEWDYELDTKGFQKKGMDIAAASANGQLNEYRCVCNLRDRLHLKTENAEQLFWFIKRDLDWYHEEASFFPELLVFMDRDTTRVIAEYELLGDGILKQEEGAEARAAHF